jgi:hypothetical protein
MYARGPGRLQEAATGRKGAQGWLRTVVGSRRQSAGRGAVARMVPLQQTDCGVESQADGSELGHAAVATPAATRPAFWRVGRRAVRAALRPRDDTRARRGVGPRFAHGGVWGGHDTRLAGVWPTSATRPPWGLVGERVAARASYPRAPREPSNETRLGRPRKPWPTSHRTADRSSPRSRDLSGTPEQWRFACRAGRAALPATPAWRRPPPRGPRRARPPARGPRTSCCGVLGRGLGRARS